MVIKLDYYLDPSLYGIPQRMPSDGVESALSNLFPPLRDKNCRHSLDFQIALTSLNAFPEKFGINLVGDWTDRMNVTIFSMSDSFFNLNLEEISKIVGKEDLFNIAKEYFQKYNEYFESVKKDFPSTVDAYWQVFRRKNSRPFFPLTNLNLDSGDKLISETIKDTLHYTLNSRQVHSQLGIPIYNFSGRGFENYETPWDLREKVAPKFEIN